jgi:hypothetical protein
MKNKIPHYRNSSKINGKSYFQHISFIWWRSVLLVKETGVPGENVPRLEGIMHVPKECIMPSNLGTYFGI